MSSTNNIQSFKVPEFGKWLKSHDLKDIGNQWILEYGHKETVSYLETSEWLKSKIDSKFKFQFYWSWICEWFS